MRLSRAVVKGGRNREASRRASSSTSRRANEETSRDAHRKARGSAKARRASGRTSQPPRAPVAVRLRIGMNACAVGQMPPRRIETEVA